MMEIKKEGQPRQRYAPLQLLSGPAKSFSHVKAHPKILQVRRRFKNVIVDLFLWGFLPLFMADWLLGGREHD